MGVTKNEIMKKLMMIAAVLLLAVACNKNQQAVKKLDGSWKATEFKVTEGGTTIDYLAFGFSLNMTFDGCKLKNDEYCSMTTTITFDGESETEASVYRVTSDGTKFEQKENKEATTAEIIDIIELTKTNAEIKMTDGETTTNIKLEKQ